MKTNKNHQPPCTGTSNYVFSTNKDVYFEGERKAYSFALMQAARLANDWISERQEQLVNVPKTHWDFEVASNNITDVLMAAAGGLAS